MSTRSYLWMAVTLLLFAVPAGASGNQEGAKKDSAPASASTAQPTPATNDPSYVIGAQDVLDISVWKEPELTRAVPVRPDGKISLPLLNDVQATGLTPLQLAAEITTELKRFVTDPQVTIIVSTDQQPTDLHFR